MKHPFTIAGVRIIAAVALAVVAPLSMAGSDVSWSVSIGSPYPAQVIAPPPVVYVQPQPVYVRPRPVYVQPATVVQYGPTYYVEEGRPKKWKHKHWKHHQHRHYDY